MTPEQRVKVKAHIVAFISQWSEDLVEEAFELADDNDPEAEVNLDDLDSIHRFVIDWLGFHLKNEIAEEIEAILESPTTANRGPNS